MLCVFVAQESRCAFLPARYMSFGGQLALEVNKCFSSIHAVLYPGTNRIAQNTTVSSHVPNASRRSGGHAQKDLGEQQVSLPRQGEEGHPQKRGVRLHRGVSRHGGREVCGQPFDNDRAKGQVVNVRNYMHKNHLTFLRIGKFAPSAFNSCLFRISFPFLPVDPRTIDKAPDFQVGHRRGFPGLQRPDRGTVLPNLLLCYPCLCRDGTGIGPATGGCRRLLGQDLTQVGRPGGRGRRKRRHKSLRDLVLYNTVRQTLGPSGLFSPNLNASKWNNGRC